MNRCASVFGRFKKSDKKRFGRFGESLACRYLKKHGYNILARNYSTPTGEIDIIAEDGACLAGRQACLVFIEVKIRQTERYGFPEEAVDFKKMRKLTHLAELYIKRKKLYSVPVRFDIVSIVAQGVFGKKSIRLIKDAFGAKE